MYRPPGAVFSTPGPRIGCRFPVPGYIYINYFVILCSWMGSQIKLDNKYMGETYFQKSGTIFFDMSSASGYMGATYFQTFGPAIFDMSSASGYVGATHFQKINPRFLA